MALPWVPGWKSSASLLIQASKDSVLTKTDSEVAMVSDPKNIALISIEAVPDGMRPLGFGERKYSSL